jgi:hypothetical protein
MINDLDESSSALKDANKGNTFALRFHVKRVERH